MQKLIIVTSIHADFDARVWRHAVSCAQEGVNVHLVCPWAVPDGEILNGVVIHSFERVNGRLFRIWRIPIRVFSKLTPLLGGADLVHFHDIDLLPWMALLKILKINIVYDVHENYPEEMLTRSWIPGAARKPMYYIVRYLQLLLSLIVKNVVLVTEYQLKDFNSNRINKFLLKNYASVALAARRNNNYLSRRPAVIFLGSQNVVNGSLLFLDIAEAYLTIDPSVVFFSTNRFGDKEFNALYLNEISKRGLSNVHILPNVLPINIMNNLNIATIAINPVLRVEKQVGAINTKLFEFMAAGLPIITSDLPFPKWLITDAVCGLLAQPENVSSFVESIKILIDNPEDARMMGENGRIAFLARYSWESQVNDLMKYYSEII